MDSSALSARTAQNPHGGLANRPAVQPARNDNESRKELNGANVPQPGRARKSRLKRMALMVSIVLATLGLARLAYTWWAVGRFIESTDDAYVGGDVTVIAPKVAGFISKLFVGDNQQVSCG
jgi:multidrug resistance efflux pump